MNGKTNHESQKAAKQPTHDVSVKRSTGDGTRYERIGAGWQRDDGSIYVRLIGTQLVTEGFTLYAIDEAAR
ncbi:hypothetical protein [Methylobacterium fujisawaense]|uniref:hypothetical protein n=1 Tax=Methylobacterium TaxID=407 RepID=UPI0036FEC44D